VVTFSVALADAHSTLLRSNQRVDVLVVTGRRERALRAERGPGLNAGTDSVFVVEGNELRRVPVRIGLVGFDRVEVLDGLAPGDEVVVSDMSAWQKVERLNVR